MWWPFKKKKVIDLTEQAGGSVSGSVKSNLGSYKDLTSNSDSASTSPESALGFLTSMASSASSGPSLKETSALAPENLSLRHLKVKLEDVEYKIDSLRSRVDKILDRLDLAEKRLDRIDRR